MSETGGTASGSLHSPEDLPIVIIGGSALIDSGQFLNIDRPHSDLLLTIARAACVKLDTFGDPALQAAAIAQLLR